MVGGKVVYAAGDLRSRSTNARRRRPCPTGRRCEASAATAPGVTEGAPLQKTLRQAAAACGCASGCGIHGHEPRAAWASKLPVSDLKSFWGALGCACWAV